MRVSRSGSAAAMAKARKVSTTVDRMAARGRLISVTDMSIRGTPLGNQEEALVLYNFLTRRMTQQGLRRPLVCFLRLTDRRIEASRCTDPALAKHPALLIN